MAGLDSPLGANEVQAGQPHRSGPVNSRRPTEVEFVTIHVVSCSALTSLTKEVNEACDSEVGILAKEAISPGKSDKIQTLQYAPKQN